MLTSASEQVWQYSTQVWYGTLGF